MKSKRGFALLTVLWLITAVSAIVGVGVAATRLGLQASINRVVLTRGRWAGEACLAIAQVRWRQHRLPDSSTINLGGRTRCSWRVDDPGARINRSPDDGPGTVNLNAASASVLLTLPGIGAEAVERILARRSFGHPVASLDELAALLSPSARASLLAEYSDLARIVTFAPNRLLITATGWVEGEAPRATIEIMTVPLPERLATIRRRMW
jgi:type II secretory pathway component PulK